MASWLIVDDNPTFRSLARRLLEDEGHVVVGEVGDARAAIVAARTLRPEAVLLDVHLPDASGFDLVAAFADAAVVLASSYDDSDYGELARQRGARAFVAKHELTAAAIAEAIA